MTSRINDFQSTAEFMRWLRDADAWTHGFVRGRVRDHEGYDDEFFARCKELEIEGAGGLSFLLLLATESTGRDRERYATAQKAVADGTIQTSIVEH
jgi:hypothetical protein